MDIRQRPEPMRGQGAIELGLLVARNAVENRPVDLHLRGELIVAEKNNRAAHVGQAVVGHQVLEAQIPVGDGCRREETSDALAGDPRQVTGIDPMPPESPTTTTRLSPRSAAGSLLVEGSRGRGVSMVGR